MDDDSFTEYLIDILGYEQAYHFYLVSKDLKPGVMFLDLNSDYKSKIKENCPEKYEIYVQESELFKPSLFRSLSTRFGLASEGLYNIYISQDSERIRKLEESLNSDKTDSVAMGRFLGYPEEAIEYFNTETSGSPVHLTKNKIQEMEEKSNLSSEEAKLVNFVEFVPANNEESIYHAVERGRKFKNCLENDTNHVSEIFKTKIMNETYRN